MFRKQWWSGKIISDEGFTVSFSARNTLVYEAGRRTMTVRTEGDGKAIDVFQNSMSRWDNDSSEVDAPTNKMIADNIVRALEFRGFRAYLVSG